ncbi:hypothetical protein X798_00284 [Onchocerca flexuosa]|uniref:Cytochrome b561 domain-containing protein n=1 Tax=Onchocerca flexuosa TaxID=387005 RepID=A0A238C5D4_9BILA|nr:hypothetical protein X798_00284 [Onchocerca flexuosa]
MNVTNSSITIFIILFVTVCSSQLDLSECRKDKTCLFVSEHCEEMGNCEKIVSYAVQSNEWIIIELFYNTTHPGTNYAAIGFSEDTQMGDDGVTHCGFDEKTNQMNVFLSQNYDKRNRPLNLTAENTTEYVELLQGSHTSDSIYCKFRQKIMPDKAAQNAFVPDLNRTYYLLLAYGETSKYGELGIHSLDTRSEDFPTFISTPVNVATGASAPVKPVKLPTNRILMLVGWMWLIPSAIVAARYLREHWPEVKPFDLKIWFHIHRTLNYVAVILAIISVFSVFIGKKWRWTGPSVHKSRERNLSAGAIHSIIGVIAVGVMVIQPISAFLRCDQGSTYRPIFNWSHRCIGLLTFLLGQIAIILSVIFFRLWIARWAVILSYAVYLILIKINSLKGKQSTTVSYAGRHYQQEQIVITKAKQDNKTKKLLLLVVMAFSILGAVITIVMAILMLAIL